MKYLIFLIATSCTSCMANLPIHCVHICPSVHNSHTVRPIVNQTNTENYLLDMTTYCN